MIGGNDPVPKTYVVNTPVLTDYGTWRFEGPIDTSQAKAVLDQGFTSAIGHEGSARFLSDLLDLELPVNRIRIKMEQGDRALVLRIKARLPEGVLLTKEEMHKLPFELGLLTRIR